MWMWAHVVLDMIVCSFDDMGRCPHGTALDHVDFGRSMGAWGPSPPTHPKHIHYSAIMSSRCRLLSISVAPQILYRVELHTPVESSPMYWYRCVCKLYSRACYLRFANAYYLAQSHPCMLMILTADIVQTINIDDI